MLSKYKDYARALARRVIVILIVVLFAFTIHRVSLGLHHEIAGAIIFIVLFTSGLLYYYINLFRTKGIHPREFIASLFLVFFWTVVMFGLIYNQPIEDSHSYFIENNAKESSLSLSSSFYFSTVTITTLGYGDIAPVGSYRYFAMTEVVLGLIYVGTILYFVTRAFE